MNNFEKYIQDNKKKLELDGVNPEIWLSIENRVLKNKNRKSRFYLKIVSTAAIFLLGMVVATFLFQNRQFDLSAEFGDLPQTVQIKTQNLKDAKIPLDRAEDFKILLNQLEFLDTQYQDYLQYIEVNGYQKFIGDQILNYYKTKIDLLDKIQSEIEKVNYYESKYNLESPTISLDI